MHNVDISSAVMTLRC